MTTAQAIPTSWMIVSLSIVLSFLRDPPPGVIGHVTILWTHQDGGSGCAGPDTVKTAHAPWDPSQTVLGAYDLQDRPHLQQDFTMIERLSGCGSDLQKQQMCFISGARLILPTYLVSTSRCCAIPYPHLSCLDKRTLVHRSKGYQYHGAVSVPPTLVSPLHPSP